MLGLIIKDFFSLKKSGRILLPIVLFFFVMSFAAGNLSFATGYIMVMVMLLPITTMSYDSASKWDTYAVSLPISRKKIVLAKYLLLLLLTLIGTVFVILLSMLAWGVHMKGFNLSETKYTVLLCAGGGIFITSILLPLVYKFGVEKSRYILFAIFILPYLAISLAKFLPVSFHLDTAWISSHQALLIVAAVFLLFVIFIASYCLSAYQYKKKDL